MSAAPGWPGRCWCGVYHRPGDGYEISQDESDAAVKLMTDRHGSLPPSLQKVIDMGGRIGLPLPRHGVDPDPPRCGSCGHPFGAGCECTCCYDDHGEEPGPHE